MAKGVRKSKADRRNDAGLAPLLLHQAASLYDALERHADPMGTVYVSAVTAVRGYEPAQIAFNNDLEGTATPYRVKRAYQRLVEWGCVTNRGPSIKVLQHHPRDILPDLYGHLAPLDELTRSRTLQLEVATTPANVQTEGMTDGGDAIATAVAHEMWTRYEHLLIEVTQLRGELSALRRENELLRKQPADVQEIARLMLHAAD